MGNINYIISINDNGPHTIFCSGITGNFSHKVEGTFDSGVKIDSIEQSIYGLEKEIQELQSLKTLPNKNK